MNEKKICPVTKIKEERLTVLLYNTITILNEMTLTDMSQEEKINFMKNEIGFTDRELEKLEIVKNCL